VLLSATASGYPSAARPAVLVTPAGQTEANLGLGPWPFGDYNADGVVAFDDLEHMAPCLTGPDNGPPAAGCDLFDSEADNDTDVVDLAAFQTAFGA
jgi:hypothetical protein